MALRAVSGLLAVSMLTGCSASEQVLSPNRVQLSTENGGLTVRSDFLVNSCGEPERLEVMESETVVEVRTVISVDRGDCDDVGIPSYDIANLDAPLGQRKLVAVE